MNRRTKTILIIFFVILIGVIFSQVVAPSEAFNDYIQAEIRYMD